MAATLLPAELAEDSAQGCSPDHRRQEVAADSSGAARLDYGGEARAVRLYGVDDKPAVDL